MHYPLTLSFKIAALAPQIFVRDAQGQELLYVKQKLMKLKDKINVFADSGQTRQIYEINADRIIDFNARFTYTDTSGKVVGGVQRKGGKSLWKATYEVQSADGRAVALIQEENPWVKVLDALVSEIPIVNLFTGYMLNPKYLVNETATQRPVLRVTKSKSFLESKFAIERLEGSVDETAETSILLSILIMVLHERRRG
jgi:uncharacterized protein YxjI